MSFFVLCHTQNAKSSVLLGVSPQLLGIHSKMEHISTVPQEKTMCYTAAVARPETALKYAQSPKL